MKTVCVSALILLASLVGHSQERRMITLESADGRSIEAKVVKKVNDSPITYRVQREDGKEFDLRISNLSSDSIMLIGQEMVRQELGVPADFEGIWVTHTVTKHISGKFHYWFNIRNFTDKDFHGEVEITLLNKMPGITNGEAKFSRESGIDSGFAAPAKMEAHTGPPSVHGGASVVAATFVATENGAVVSEGKIAIPDQISQ